MSETKVERYNGDAYNITRDGEVIALVNRLTSNRWILKDTNDQRIGSRTFESPKEAHAYFVEEIQPAPDAPRMG